jgi:hypothetical protein
MPSLQQHQYVALAPTVADAIWSQDNYATFVVSAHTQVPYIWFVSPPDSGCSVDNSVTGVVQGPAMPQQFILHQNVPNPFNPLTSISYEIPRDGGKVTLRVFDVGGRIVRTLVDARQTPGRKTVQWDGKNYRGEKVASGVYFYQLKALGYVNSLKMILIE